MPESSVNLLCPIFCTFYATENWHESVFVSIKKKKSDSMSFAKEGSEEVGVDSGEQGTHF